VTEPQPEARAVCEHFYASHCYRGMSIRLCMTCHEPDWDDLAGQLASAARGSEIAVPSPPVAAALDREHLGRIAHEVRCAENAKRDRSFRLEPWERRAPSQQELDMKIGEAVAAAVLGSDESGPDLD